MDQTLSTDDRCRACGDNRCDQCDRPGGTRLDATDVERPTCCCGRRFRPFLNVNASGCPKWCRLEAGHDELHTDHIAAVVGQRRATVAITVEAASRDGEPLPVLTAGNGTVARVALDWDQLDQLIDAATKARERYT